MAFVYGDRVKETSLTNGTITMVLGGATVGFQSFAVGVGITNECFYGIVNTADDTWEMGRGTVGPGTLSRDTIISSTNSNLIVDFTAGQKVVYTTVPRTFYEAALDAISHAAVDHTLSPLSLLNEAAHEAVDHTAAPFNLLATAQLPAEHELINHLAAPFNLLDNDTHNLIDHRDPPFNLITDALHASTNHFSLITSVIPQVSGGEKTDGTDVNLKSYSPLDIADMAGTHGPGILVQETRFADGELATTTGGMPGGDTIPQDTEGGEFMVHTHTPLDAANILLIEVSTLLQSNIGGFVVCALFRDGAGAGAIASGLNGTPGAGFQHPAQVHIDFRQVAGTTSPITFRVRGGSNQGGSTTTFNGAFSARIHGGVLQSSIRVSEFSP